MPGTERLAEAIKFMKVDVVISFDTTGSMYPCLTEVRRNVKDMVERLFRDVPNIRIGIVAHGDYCDIGDTYLLKMQDLTGDKEAIIRFINETGNTGGGDTDEAYEYVLNKVQKMTWESDGVRALVVIADAYPHPLNYRFPADIGVLDWRKEADELGKMGVAIYSVQCLNHGNGQSYTFFKTMAEKTKGFHLQLAQFSTIAAVLTAICLKQGFGDERVQQYQQELVDTSGSKLSVNMQQIFNIILGKEAAIAPEAFETRYASTPSRRARSTTPSHAPRAAGTDLRPVPPSSFQVIGVDHDVSIKQFVIDHGLPFKTGRGFYEFTKRESISLKKEVVLMDRATGDLFSGDAARELAGIPLDRDADVSPPSLEKYRAFVQSTSYNRKLVGGTGFLYEVDEDR
jgi:hypothetical protein